MRRFPSPKGLAHRPFWGCMTWLLGFLPAGERGSGDSLDSLEGSPIEMRISGNGGQSRHAAAGGRLIKLALLPLFGYRLVKLFGLVPICLLLLLCSCSSGFCHSSQRPCHTHTPRRQVTSRLCPRLVNSQHMLAFPREAMLYCRLAEGGSGPLNPSRSWTGRLGFAQSASAFTSGAGTILLISRRIQRTFTNGLQRAPTHDQQKSAIVCDGTPTPNMPCCAMAPSIWEIAD
jgi:hypothetical protein